MKQLNFRHLTLTVKIIWNSKFFLERSKNGSKKANIILFSTSRSFRPFYDNSFRIPEDCGRFPKTNEEVQLLPKMSKNHQTLNSIFSGNSKTFKKLPIKQQKLKIMGR